MPIKHNTCSDYYRARKLEGGDFLHMFQAKMVVFNGMKLDNLNSPNALKLTITSSKFNFLLLPGPDKNPTTGPQHHHGTPRP
jgi:hypothetical protein